MKLFLRMLQTVFAFTLTGVIVGGVVISLTFVIKEHNGLGFVPLYAPVGAIFGGGGGALLGVLLFYPLREDSLLLCSLFTGGLTSILSLAAGIAGHIGFAALSVPISIPISFIMWFGLKAQRMDAELLENGTLDDKV